MRSRRTLTALVASAAAGALLFAMPVGAQELPSDLTTLQPHAGVPQKITLDQAYSIAVAQSPAFASERAQYDAIRAKYGAAKGALFPNVSASGSATRSYGSSSSTGTGTTQERAAVSVQQLIFDGGRVIAGLKSAREGDLAGAATLQRALQTLEFNVARAYFGVLQSQATVNATQQSVRQFQTTEDSVRARIRVGAGARSDLSSAQFQTARARGQLVLAQGQAVSAQSAFASTLGLDADTDVVPQAAGANPSLAQVPTYQKSLAQGLLLRPDYIAAQHNVTAAYHNVRFAKLARFPSITADASDGTGRLLYANAPASQTNWSHGASIGANISVPIFDQGLTNFNVAQAQSQYDQAAAGLTASKLGVESDVRSALSGLVSARANLTQAQLEQSSAQVALNAARARYKVGVATIVDLVTAETDFSQAQTDYVNAVYNAQVAEQTYNYAVGTTGLGH